MRELRNKLIAVIAVFAVLTASSCGGGQSSPPVQTVAAEVTEAAPQSVSQTEADETDEPDVTEPPAETEQAPVDADEITEMSDMETPKAGSAETEAPVSEASDADTTVSGSSPESSDPAQPETTAAVSETAAETTTTTAAATTAAETTTTTTASPETTTTTAPAKSAEPSPPQISKVSSPGTNVFSADTAVLDYSNCADGYISVDYKGSTRLKMILKNGSSQFDFDIYAGKGVQYFTLAQGSGTYDVELYEMVDNGKFIKLFAESFKTKISDDVRMFTYKNQFVNFDSNSKCVAKASEVCAGCTTNLDKISAVFQYITDNITYDKALAASVTSGYIPDPDSVLARKQGICFDYASLTAAMLRSQGVPTRLVIGYASPNIYHAWNEVYTPEKGWIAAEIMLDGTGFRRIDATFYASAADKQTFADYIAKSGNYSDVYVY